MKVFRERGERGTFSKVPQAADFQAAMLHHIILDFLIGSLPLRISQIQLVNVQFDLNLLLRIEFGQ